MPTTPTQPDETQTLRRSVRELAALSTLSAVWSGSTPLEIAEGLGGVLLRSLGLTLVYVRVNGLDDSVVFETARSLHGPATADQAREIGKAFQRVLENGNGATEVPNPLGGAAVRLSAMPLGFDGDSGLLVAAAEQPDFPTPTDRLMLSVAANQAAIVLQQRRSQQRIRRSEQELADFFDNATIGLHWVGPDGTIVRVNQAELDLLGYTASEYIGRHISEFHVDKDVIDDILRRLWNGEQVRDYEARMRCSDGAMKHVVIDSSVLWQDGQFIHTRCFTRDITERKRGEEALRTQTERLRLLWEAAAVLLTAETPDVMLHGLHEKIGRHLGVDVYFNYIVDDSGRLLRLASCEGVGIEDAQRIARLEFGQAICGNVALQRRPIVATHIQQSDDPIVQLVKGLGIRSYACNPLLAGDRLLGTLSFASRFKDEFDADEVAFIETITSYVTVAYERLRLLNELQEADRRKDHFLATLAHELRNPLAPIRSAVQVLHLKGSQVPEARWARDVIDRQIDHLTRLIDDLLDVSRITLNKLELRRRPVALSDVITGAVESTRSFIEQRKHELTVTLPPEPIYLDGDFVRLAQVFLNLLNNAAKYTESGGRIWLTAGRQANTLVVRVKDSGVGIPAEKLPRLFEMFYQVDASLERAHGGLGIGLSLVRRLVEAHGGSVEARSEGLGCGSEFIVRLPILIEQPQSLPLEPSSEADSTTKHIRILVVDDNRDSADLFAMFLRLRGHETFTAYDGAEAITAAERFRPEAVLLDIGMPHMSGEDVCRQIRATPWGRTLLLIAMTGWDQEESRRRILEAGFDAHLVKPVDHEAVIQLLDARARSNVGVTVDEHGRH
jgi:PAS domain S-box-containing protein